MKCKLIVWVRKGGRKRKVQYSCASPQEAHRRALGFKGMKCKVVGGSTAREPNRKSQGYIRSNTEQYGRLIV